MAKKRQPRVPILPNLNVANLADDFGDADLPDVQESDILQFCGVQNATRGRGLYEQGMVTQRKFDGTFIMAQVQDGNNGYEPDLDPLAMETNCDCPATPHRRNFACEHVAALMYAFLREPDSFMPQNMGDLLNALQSHPELGAEAGLDNPEIAQVLELLQSAPPEVRAALNQIPINASPEDLAKHTAGIDLNQIREAQVAGQLKSLLERQTLPKLQQLAKRRGWTLTAQNKTATVNELAKQLQASPVPADFAPEEKQLLSIANTLYGFADLPTQPQLRQWWNKRGGGDQSRFDRALNGLQNAGVLFACPGEGFGPHFHWSPFLDSTAAPLLDLKIKLYPVDQVVHLSIAPPVLPAPQVIANILQMAELAPLRARPKIRDARFDKLPYMGEWDYDPQELQKFGKVANNPWSVNALTVPFTRYFDDGTLDALAGLTGEGREGGGWYASLMVNIQLLQHADSGAIPLHTQRIQEWQTFPPEEQYRILWTAWRIGATGFGELRMGLENSPYSVRRSTFDPNFTIRALLSDIGLARQLVARVLTLLQPLTWYSWPSLAESVQSLRPDFLYTQTTPQQWFITEAHTNQIVSFHQTPQWHAAFRPILQAMLTGPLHWLGALELGYVDNEVVAFQITPLGLWLLGDQQSELPIVAPETNETGETLTWLNEDTFRVRPSREAATVLGAVRAFSDSATELLTFRLTNSALTRALSNQLTIDDIARTFSEVDATLPDALRERIAALAANFGRTHLYEKLTVLELNDDYALQELLAMTSLRQHIIHQFSPRVVVIRDDEVEAFVAELVKKGYTPKVV